MRRLEFLRRTLGAMIAAPIATALGVERRPETMASWAPGIHTGECVRAGSVGHPPLHPMCRCVPPQPMTVYTEFVEAGAPTTANVFAQNDLWSVGGPLYTRGDNP